MRGRIDGLIAMAPDKASAAAMHSIARGFPVVLLDPRARISGCCTVSVANQGGAAAMVEHLVRLGHREVAIVKGPVGNVDAEDRLRGWRQALRAAGLEVRAGWQIEGDFSEAAGYRAAKALLALRPRPSAVFAANDYMALGLLSALRDAGIDVPREMAVTGFDDIAIAQYLSPPLTTVRVDAYELGARAVQLWMQAAAGNGAAPRHEVSARASRRASLVRRDARACSRYPGRARPPRPHPGDGRGRRCRQRVPRCFPITLSNPKSDRSSTRRPEAMNQRPAAVLLAITVLAGALPAFAQAPRQDSFWARKATGPITLDGILNEAEWAKAESMTVRWATDSGIPGSGWKARAASCRKIRPAP
jgi:hypothetical protein